MLANTTIEGLKALRLDAMAAGPGRAARAVRLLRARLRGTPRPARRPRAHRTRQPAPGTLPENSQAAHPGHRRGHRLPSPPRPGPRPDPHPGPGALGAAPPA